MKLLYLASLLFLFIIAACKSGDQKADKGSSFVFNSKQRVERECRGKHVEGLKKLTQKPVQARHCTSSDTLVTGHIKQINMVSRKTSATGNEFGYRAIYDTGVTWTIMFRPVDEAGSSVDAWGYVSMPAKHKGDTLIEKTLLQDMAALMPGCRRIANYGSMPFVPHDVHSATADPGEYSMILFRGRYDAELN